MLRRGLLDTLPETETIHYLRSLRWACPAPRTGALGDAGSHECSDIEYVLVPNDLSTAQTPRQLELAAPLGACESKDRIR